MIASNANGGTTLDDDLVRHVDDLNSIGVTINNKDRPTQKYAWSQSIYFYVPIRNHENWAPTSLFAEQNRMTIIDPHSDYALTC